MKTCCITLFLLLTISCCFAQVETNQIEYSSENRFYAYWGWNRGWYTNSDISFEGATHDFTLQDVVAKDRQDEFTIDNYFNPSHITIPQYNFRLGYFLNEKYDISFGIDHMKYVVVQNQEVKITGTIADTESGYDGIYQNEDIELKRDFLQFEHTDGLNLLSIELKRNDLLISRGKFKLVLIEGFALSALTPRSDITLLNFDNFDKWILSGYGINASLGMKVQFKNLFFIQTELKGGFIHLPYVRSTPDKTDLANQKFLFSQWNVTFGSEFSFKRKNR